MLFPPVFERTELIFYFRDNIYVSHEIFVRAVELSLRFYFSGFELCYAGSFLENHSAVFGFGGHNLFYLALSDYRITLFTDAAFVQQIDYIFKSCGLFVYKILACRSYKAFVIITSL